MNIEELIKKCRLTDNEIDRLEDNDDVSIPSSYDPELGIWETPDFDDLLDAQLRKAIPLVLMEIGLWLDDQDGVDYGDDPDEPMRGFVSLDIKKADIEALKRGEMPGGCQHGKQ